MEPDKREAVTPDLELRSQYWEIEQPDGSVIELHVQRLVRPTERIPLIVRSKAVEHTPIDEE